MLNTTPYGRPDKVATGVFLAKQYNQLGTELPNEQMGVLCVNNIQQWTKQQHNSLIYHQTSH